MKKKRKKLMGVTLLELIIVLAIFSGIAAGAVAMIRPALQIFHKTSEQEKAIASVDSIGRYIQDNIRYADKVMIYTNTGIEHAVNYNDRWDNQFCNYPFAYKAFDIKYQIQKTERLNGVDVIAAQGAYDENKLVNPVAYFIKYHFTESLCFRGVDAKFSELTLREVKECDEYFKDKVVNLMEIKENGEVNVYEFPLKNNVGMYDEIDGMSDDDPNMDKILKNWELDKGYTHEDPAYYGVSCGQMGIYLNEKENNPINSYSVNTDFFDEKIRVNGELKNSVSVESIELSGGSNYPGNASGGMTVNFSYMYKGSTGVIRQSYKSVVSFVNINDKEGEKDTDFVNDRFPYYADAFQYFDCEGKDINFYGGKGTKGGSTFIVYTIPNIVSP